MNTTAQQVLAFYQAELEKTGDKFHAYVKTLYRTVSTTKYRVIAAHTLKFTDDSTVELTQAGCRIL